MNGEPNALAGFLAAAKRNTEAAKKEPDPPPAPAVLREVPAPPASVPAAEPAPAPVVVIEPPPKIEPPASDPVVEEPPKVKPPGNKPKSSPKAKTKPEGKGAKGKAEPLPPRQWYGTIEEEYVRKRDDVATRKRGFTLSIALITRLEKFCTDPKRSTNLAAEEALTKWLDQAERKK